MNRFSIDNRFRKVSLNQYKTVAEGLESAVRNVRPAITSELLLTTDKCDYNGYGSLTIVTPASEDALARRERHQLSDLNEGLWERSFETGLYLRDNSIENFAKLTIES